MPTITSVLITGANIGLGRESARQLALRDEVEKIYLAGRNPEKLYAARDSLEQETGRSIFETVILGHCHVNRRLPQRTASTPFQIAALALAHSLNASVRNRLNVGLLSK